MQSKIKMVVFDMAGTTVDENNLVYKTLHKAITASGKEVTLEEVLEHGAGKEKKEAIRSTLKACCGSADEALVDNIFSNFLPMLGQAYHVEPVLPQKNALETFEKLRAENILVVLNTGYNRETAESLLHKLNWREGVEIDALITASDVGRNRPDPDMIELAIQKFNIGNSNEVAKIGDSTIDILEGKNAGCGLSIGITTGAHNKAQLETANPDYIVDDLKELAEIVIQHEKSVL